MNFVYPVQSGWTLSIMSESGQGTNELGEDFSAPPRFQYTREPLRIGLVDVSSTRRDITHVFYLLRLKPIDEMTGVLTNG
jgi:hypothetical protein